MKTVIIYALEIITQFIDMIKAFDSVGSVLISFLDLMESVCISPNIAILKMDYMTGLILDQNLVPFVDSSKAFDI